MNYGYLGVWHDPATGRRRRVWAFSMVLSFSRHLFVFPVLRMDQQAWVDAHLEGWRIDYNMNQPHSAHDGLSPTEFVQAGLNRQQPQHA